MKKEALKEFQLQAGGSHYPTVNPDQQALFARLLVEECIGIIKEAPRGIALTTFQDSIVEAIQERCLKSICAKFGMNYEQYRINPKSYKNYMPGKSRLDAEG